MIEIDGKAIPLEPGKKYLVLFNPNYIPQEWPEKFHFFCQHHRIDVFLMPVEDINLAVRVVSIEKPEVIPAKEPA